MSFPAERAARAGETGGAAHLPRDARPRPESRLILPLLGALLAALLLLRSPESLLRPQFWAEDGTSFYQEAFNLGFLKTVMRPVSGYQLLLPRLVAGFSLIFPMERAPLVFSLAAFAVQLAPALYLLSPRMARVIPSFPGRVVAALLYIALPASYETHVNLTNSHWYLTLTAVCMLVAAPAAGATARLLESFALLLFSLTGPFSILFLPLVAPRLVGALRGAPADRTLTLSLLVAAGATIQAATSLTSERLVAGASRFGHLSPRELMTAVSMHTFFNALLGIRGLSKIADSLTPAMYGLGLLGLAFFVFVAVRDRIRPLLILLYLAVLSIALWAVFPLNDPRIWLRPHAGPRYFLFACLFILLASLHLSRTAWPLRGVGLALLGVAVCVGIPADFTLPRHPDVRWADNVATFRSLPAGASFSIPVVPLFHPPLVLRKQTPQRGQPPLSRLRPLESQTPASYAVTRPGKVTLNDPSNTTLLSVAGWATDGTLSKPAGGVFVMIDDRAFPAVYGLPAALPADGVSCPDCGFSRLIPVDEIGPGPHQVSIAVVTRDGTGYYRPPAPRTFDASQFPPDRALPN